jgi:hypothetical protein
LPNLLALNLTNSDFHKNKIIDLVKELTHGKGEAYLLFRATTSLGDFAPPPPPTGHLLMEPWARAGHPDFHLTQD